MSAIFVSGSGTEIGKTFVTAALIHEYRRRGRNIAALKPVASGIDPERLADSDPGILLAALGMTATQETLDRIAPWRLRAALSPDMAARREGRVIDVGALLEFCRHAAAEAESILLIEGVGGVMVPLDERHTVLDWMAALRSPVLLVAGSYLGAISHALTALDALVRRDLAVAALVVNETPGSSVELEETAASIARFVAPVPAIALPRLPRSDAPHPAIAMIADRLETLIDAGQLDRAALTP